MTFTRNLGTFDSFQDVWDEYPSGGQAGDYLSVNGRIYCWDSITQNWVSPSQQQSPARQVKTFEGDVHVGNNLVIGGILEARVVRGRDAFCGLYATSTALNTFCPSPLVGQWALVMIQVREAESMALGEVYYCETAGTWTDAGYESDVAGIINQLLNMQDEIDANDYAVITNAEMDAVLTDE